ncbi:MAG: type II toxin-antitoxin system Phd/YefM family antitoxin [Alphaproteobacteria bacterium]|nr:type II toxin-antitoxin system Phd/YefM family antitoxin [Alphaproteobacteria bacterium]
MSHLSANDLKVKGVSALEAALETSREVLITVRGKDRFVVMEVEHYHYLRECELEAALAESRADLAAGRFVKSSPEAHVERLKAGQ